MGCEEDVVPGRACVNEHGVGGSIPRGEQMHFPPLVLVDVSQAVRRLRHNRVGALEEHTATVVAHSPSHDRGTAERRRSASATRRAFESASIGVLEDLGFGAVRARVDVVVAGQLFLGEKSGVTPIGRCVEGAQARCRRDEVRFPFMLDVEVFQPRHSSRR